MHTAYREVDRRLVYIDPHPDRPNITPRTGIPGFFATLRGALSDLPRHDPIYEELAETNRFNDQISRLKAIVRMSRPHVDSLIEQATGGGLSDSFTEALVRHWRLTSTNLLASSAIVYNAWMRSLVLEAVDVISGLMTRICGYESQSQQAHWILRVVESWCEREGMFPDNYHIPDTVNADVELPLFARFIVNFGVKYKARRIYYLLEHINSLYESDINQENPVDDEIDELKRQVSERLRSLYAFEDPTFLTGLPGDAIKLLFCVEHFARIPDAVQYASDNRSAITDIIDQIGTSCGLVGANEELDAILSSPLVVGLHPDMRRTVLSGYLGWPYWDVVVLPTMNALGLETNAFEEVLVDRISPKDATSICVGEDCGQLRGEAAIGFGGFLSRGARENDYLWGRIHAIDRLIDIIASTVDPALASELPDYRSIKKRAFEAVLRQEEERLPNIPEVLEVVRSAIAAL